MRRVKGAVECVEWWATSATDIDANGGKQTLRVNSVK